MKKYIAITLTVLVCLTLSVLGFVFSNYTFSDVQKDTLITLLIICAASATYCFIVGEISRNNSQMDKLWSILPIAYTWVVAAKDGFGIRTLIIAIIVSLWGIRLTFNFARKGAYHLKFWEGEEDYRWPILRSKKPLSNPFLWALFNLFFICIYQNALVLAMTLPSVVVMGSTATFGVFDYVATFLAVGFLLLELVADEQQWKFQETKKKLLSEGKSLDELPAPYNLGFNTVGLWGIMRHPNYLGEQAIWVCLYLFTIGAGVNTYYVFNWSLFGAMFIILLFLGSSTFGESISSKKYENYKYYAHQVPKYFPLRRYDPEKKEL